MITNSIVFTFPTRLQARQFRNGMIESNPGIKIKSPVKTGGVWSVSYSKEDGEPTQHEKNNALLIQVLQGFDARLNQIENHIFKS